MLDREKEICEKCLNGKYINCIKNKCVKNSTLKSVLGAIEGRYYRNKKIYTKQIDKIITPSNFYKKKLIEDGIQENKVVALHNFIDLKEYDLQTKDEHYGLYIGRLSKEKGILNLIKAVKKLEDVELRIAGDGPEKEKIIEFIKKHKLENKIKILGFLSKNEVKDQIRKCRFVVVPSIWYENCPYSVMETLAIGKPVIGANIGGIPELVKNQFNGLTYKYDSVDELASNMKILYNDKKVAEKLGKNGKKEAKKLYSKETYYENIIKIYNNLIEER